VASKSAVACDPGASAAELAEAAWEHPEEVLENPVTLLLLLLDPAWPGLRNARVALGLRRFAAAGVTGPENGAGDGYGDGNGGDGNGGDGGGYGGAVRSAARRRQ